MLVKYNYILPLFNGGAMLHIGVCGGYRNQRAPLAQYEHVKVAVASKQVRFTQRYLGPTVHGCPIRQIYSVYFLEFFAQATAH